MFCVVDVVLIGLIPAAYSMMVTLLMVVVAMLLESSIGTSDQLARQSPFPTEEMLIELTAEERLMPEEKQESTSEKSYTDWHAKPTSVKTLAMLNLPVPVNLAVVDVPEWEA